MNSAESATIIITGSRKFCQRGSNCDNAFLFVFIVDDKNKQKSVVTVGPHLTKGAKEKYYQGAEEFSFRDFGILMHYFKGSREHRRSQGTS